MIVVRLRVSERQCQRCAQDLAPHSPSEPSIVIMGLALPRIGHCERYFPAGILLLKSALHETASSFELCQGELAFSDRVDRFMPGPNPNLDASRLGDMDQRKRRQLDEFRELE